MIRVITWTHIPSVWNHSGPSEVPYSANQLLVRNIFFCFLQQTDSNTKKNRDSYFALESASWIRHQWHLSNNIAFLRQSQTVRKKNMQNRSPITSCLYFTSNKNIDSKDSDDYFFLYSTSSTSYDILTSQNSDLGIEFAFFF